MMDEQITRFCLDVSKQLGEINAKLTNFCDTIAKHEIRITDLEKNKVGFKDQIVKWLVIALISSLGTIATLTGASTLISRIMGL